MSAFTDKTLLITGGTGSFGNAVLNRFLQTDIGEIRIFSRDEKKQDDMRHEFQAVSYTQLHPTQDEPFKTNNWFTGLCDSRFSYAVCCANVCASGSVNLYTSSN